MGRVVEVLACDLGRTKGSWFQGRYRNMVFGHEHDGLILIILLYARKGAGNRTKRLDPLSKAESTVVYFFDFKIVAVRLTTLYKPTWVHFALISFFIAIQ